MNFDRTDLNGFYINQISNRFKLKPVVEFRTSNADMTFYKDYIRLQPVTSIQNENPTKYSKTFTSKVKTRKPAKIIRNRRECTVGVTFYPNYT